MPLNTGDTITYCIMPGMQRYGATLLSIDDVSIELQLDAGSPSTLPQHQHVLISDSNDDVDYFTEISGREGETLRLKRIWTGKRDFFRVESIFPVIYKKVGPHEPWQESRIFTGFGGDVPVSEPPDDSVSPQVWKMMVDINAKLDLVLEQFHLESEGLTKAKSIAVNISSSGIRFASDLTLEIGEVLEIKMLLPANPAVGVLAHGKVVRIENMKSGAREISLHFIDLVDEVREVILQYTLKRQRDLVRRYREQGV